MGSVSRMAESFEDSSYFDVRKSRGLLSRQAIIHELTRPCSRFSFPKKDLVAELRLSELAMRFDALQEGYVLLAPSVPANWMLFARHLFQAGISAHPYFMTHTVRNDIPKIPSVTLLAPPPSSDDPKAHLGRTGSGVAFDIETAMSKAVGELLERYFLAKRRSAVVYESYERLCARRGPKPINIFELNGFLPWQQKERERYRRLASAPIQWVRGKELISGTDAYLPVQLVSLGHRTEPYDAMVLVQPTTNGAAGHFTRDEAILSGVLELIERDGFLIHWLNSLSPKRIDHTTIDDASVRHLFAQLQRYELEYYLLDVTTDVGVPSCVAVIIDRRSQEPIIAIGGSAGFSIRSVIMSALTEAYIVYRHQLREEPYVLPIDYKPFRDPKIGREERMRLWRGNSMLQQFEFFIQGPLETAEAFLGDASRYQTPQQQLAYVMGQLKEKGRGYELYVHEIQDTFLAEIGYHVVKIVVPKLVPLYLNEHMATLDAPRLQTVPSALGYEPAVELHPLPHPFP